MSHMATKVILSLALMVKLFVVVLALPSTIPHDYGYDDGSREPLLKLFDGMFIQDLLQRHPGNDKVHNYVLTYCE